MATSTHGLTHLVFARMPNCDSMPDTLILTPTPAAVAAAAAWLSRICQREHMTPSRSLGISLVLEEALTNVVQYGFCTMPDNPAAYVQLQFTHDDGHPILRLTDNGAAFDPTAVQLADQPGNVDSAILGGHGIRLMRHYTQHMRYQRLDGTNALTLVLK